MIRVVIADDEPLAREGIRALLESEEGIAVAGEAADGPDAVRRILADRPDLVFLDVQMPGLNGFQVLERVTSFHLPEVIFVTAHDEHAIRAFEVNALDYLLKPVSELRFREALRRARERLAAAAAGGARGGTNPGAGSGAPERLAGLLDSLAAGGAATGAGADSAPPAGAARWSNRFVVKDGERFVIVKADAVEWIGAASNYTEIHAGGRSYLMRGTLADLERRLDPARFARIHRSTIVNIDSIKEIVPEWHGDFDVVLLSGFILRMSRGFRDRLLPPGGRQGT